MKTNDEKWLTDQLDEYADGQEAELPAGRAHVSSSLQQTMREMQPHAVFFDGLAGQLQERQQPSEARSRLANGLWRLLASAAGVAALIAFVWFVAGLFSRPPLTASTTVEPDQLPAALPGSMKGYELYSWQEADAAWRYTLVTGTNRRKTAEELIVEANAFGEDGWVKVTVTGTGSLIDLLGRLPVGEAVFWMTPEATDAGTFGLPDSEIVGSVEQRARALGLQLTISRCTGLAGTRQVGVATAAPEVAPTPLPAGLSLTAPGWIHTIEQVNDGSMTTVDPESGDVVNLPKTDFQVEVWALLDDEGLLLSRVSQVRDLDGNLLQVTTLRDGVLRNLTLQEKVVFDGQPAPLRLGGS